MWGREPVMLQGVVLAGVYALVEFGVDWTQGQQTAVLGLSAAVLSVLTRSKVSPVEDGY